MAEVSNTYILHVAPKSDAEELANQIRLVCTESDQCGKPHAAGFGGVEFAEIILALGGSGAFIAITKIVTTWLNAQKSRLVKINGKDISGYSADDVVKILSSTSSHRRDQKHAR